MRINIKKEISFSGLSEEIIERYLKEEKTKKFILDLLKEDVFPDIILYKKKNKDNKYVLADGIHRVCAYLYLNIEEIGYKLKD